MTRRTPCIRLRNRMENISRITRTIFMQRDNFEDGSREYS